MSARKGPERMQKLIDGLRHWQEIERKAIDECTAIMESTDNPLIRQVMEIIRNDSVQHHRVQQFIIDTMTRTPVSLTPEQLGEIWDRIEAHDELERKTIEYANELRDECPTMIQKMLLDYLLYDEQKHDKLLHELEKFKKGLYPYA
ncbi:MAG: hypothetical protein Kow0062_06610 [Acidobacteriota bacterium]